MKKISMVGTKWGSLTVLRQSLFKDGKGHFLWHCRCICGSRAEVSGYNLRKGFTKSCGCLRKDMLKTKMTKHGATGTPTYNIWMEMRHRCKKPSHEKWYKEKGITVCERWNSFENFLADMGEKPKGMTLERKDSNGNYEPKNCIWATWKEQQNNRSDNHLLTYKGETKTASQWAESFGIKSGTLLRRINAYGYSVEEALTKPIKGERR